MIYFVPRVIWSLSPERLLKSIATIRRYEDDLNYLWSQKRPSLPGWREGQSREETPKEGTATAERPPRLRAAGASPVEFQAVLLDLAA
jgi:hypothetical protein